MSGHLPGAPKCPGCRKRLDGFTAVNNPAVVPGDGDLTICVYCRTPSAFVVDAAGEISMRLATPTEAVEVRTRLARRLGVSGGGL